MNFDWKTHNSEGTCEKCGGPCQRKYTHDADGNLVDGWYWSLMEETFQKVVDRAVIAILVASANQNMSSGDMLRSSAKGATYASG